MILNDDEKKGIKKINLFLTKEEARELAYAIKRIVLFDENRLCEWYRREITDIEKSKIIQLGVTVNLSDE